MAIDTVYWLFCDHPDCDDDGISASSESGVKAAARAAGYVCQELDGSWQCPEHERIN